jgi:hypothetical protein
MRSCMDGEGAMMEMPIIRGITVNGKVVNSECPDCHRYRRA